MVLVISSFGSFVIAAKIDWPTSPAHHIQLLLPQWLAEMAMFVGRCEAMDGFRSLGDRAVVVTVAVVSKWENFYPLENRGCPWENRLIG